MSHDMYRIDKQDGQWESYVFPDMLAIGQRVKQLEANIDPSLSKVHSLVDTLPDSVFRAFVEKEIARGQRGELSLFPDAKKDEWQDEVEYFTADAKKDESQDEVEYFTAENSDINSIDYNEVWEILRCHVKTSQAKTLMIDSVMLHAQAYVTRNYYPDLLYRLLSNLFGIELFPSFKKREQIRKTLKAIKFGLEAEEYKQLRTFVTTERNMGYNFCPFEKTVESIQEMGCWDAISNGWGISDEDARVLGVNNRSSYDW